MLTNTFEKTVPIVFFLDAIASPSTYPCQSVGESVSESVSQSFRFGDSYGISELSELVTFKKVHLGGL